MKKLSFVFDAVRSSVLCMVLLLSATAVGFASCGDDEEDGGTPPVDGLVSATIPSEGWSGSPTDGICTYRSENAYDDEDFSCYYAFAFENGKCVDGVFNVVCDREEDASDICKMLNSGAWAEEDDEDDYDLTKAKSRTNALSIRKKLHAKVVRSVVKSTRAANVMGITCTQDGKIVYFRLEAIKGLGGEDVKYIMKAWDTGLNMDTLPEKPMFGTWNETTGKYTSNSIYAIPGTKVEIETAFNSSDIVTKYAATFILPNDLWAEMIEESLRNQAEGWQQLGNIELNIVRNENVVTTNIVNVEIANTSKEYLVKMIIALDILNARPIGTSLF